VPAAATGMSIRHDKVSNFPLPEYTRPTTASQIIDRRFKITKILELVCKKPFGFESDSMIEP